ncbi:coiled-coil domain-containing protein 60-like isoform X2 [Hemibagrus wyckioides]|uniref:coiled-coil domain-containing protein 60-like isoform X2 n=1 Tax=Hemibagrus wyckioides TaxID=337641 RepID=UPI00266C874D|nr:coiled-coil domain-containing protein 60-like isoform X2 [Hemibagrus wyckioides]
MPQMLQPCQSLDPGRSLRDKVIYVNPNLEEEFWEKFHHKHKQVFGEVKEKITLETKKVEEEPKIELCRADEGVCRSTPPDSSLQNKDLPLKRPKSQKRGDADSLWKHLWRSSVYRLSLRKLVSAVKQGGNYFQLLLEQEEQKNEKRRKKEERRRTDLHHHQTSTSDSEIENEEERSVNGGVSSSPWRQSNRRQGERLRPFTPVHQSLTSDQPHHLSEEHVYRQLCCLCWLLEALTLERSGRFGSVASCWDAKDPGRSRNTLKAVSREKLIQAKWDRFISPPKSLFPVIRLSRITSLTHKSPALSAASSAVLTTSLPGNMSSCDVTFSGEESECPSVVMLETDPPVSKYLQKLLDEVHQSISKELYGSTTDCSSDTDMISFETLRAQYNTQDRAVTGKLESHTAKSSERSITSTVFSQEKAAMLEEMKLMFTERSQELSLRLIDTLDLQAKKRWMSGVQRYQSLSNMSASRCHTASVPCVTPSPRQESDTQDIPYSTHWLSALLSSLPTHTHSNRKMVCVLEKLKRYTQERILRIRPHVFLRVLNSLQPWELCCPELCVAIEIVRENAVRMSTDEYDCWLCGKLHLPQSAKTGR